MDGNRRWAAQQGLLSSLGHRKGFETITKIIDFCAQKQIAYLSLYTFSIENLQRAPEEQSFLFEVLAYEAIERLLELKEKNVHIKFIGDRQLFPKSVRPLCEKIEKETRSCTGLTVLFLLCYGGQQEIVDTAKRIATKVKKGDLQEADISVELFNRFLWTDAIPEPDLIVRTGGRSRLSNFLLFQAAYAELYFLDCLWPDITENDLTLALAYYQECQKNFGQ
jgi:undecaprenyl diphosphate synthase